MKGTVVGTKTFAKLRYASANPIYRAIAGRAMASCQIRESPSGTKWFL